MNTKLQKNIKTFSKKVKTFFKNVKAFKKKCLGVLGETPRGFDANDLVSYLVLGIR